MTSDAKQTVTFLLLLQNSRYREEVLDLSSRNLQLSNDNAELSARLRGDQESVRMLQERLATVSKEQEEEGASVSNSTSPFTFSFTFELLQHLQRLKTYQRWRLLSGQTEMLCFRCGGCRMQLCSRRERRCSSRRIGRRRDSYWRESSAAARRRYKHTHIFFQIHEEVP